MIIHFYLDIHLLAKGIFEIPYILKNRITKIQYVYQPNDCQNQGNISLQKMNE